MGQSGGSELVSLADALVGLDKTISRRALKGSVSRTVFASDFNQPTFPEILF